LIWGLEVRRQSKPDIAKEVNLPSPSKLDDAEIEDLEALVVDFV